MHGATIPWGVINWIAGGILALAWFSRIVDAALGMPTVADIARPEWDRGPGARGEPRVSIIVPARNEEEDIRDTLAAVARPRLFQLRSDCRQRSLDRPHRPDHGSGGRDVVAGSVPLQAGGQELLRDSHSELPSGWLGKTHAMWTAGQQASGNGCSFTDADVLFKPDSLRRAVAYAEAERADHVVLFPRMIMKRPSERMMIAFFQALFVFGHRPWKVADPEARDHMGVGAFNMVRRPVYDAVGTYRALRMEVLDDMKLGKVIKNAGFVQRNVLAEDLISLHWAKGALGIVNNLTKNFFAVLSFQWPRTVVSIVGLGFSESRAVSGRLAGPWMGASALRHRAGFAVWHLLRGMSSMSRVPLVLLLSASGQHQPVHVHAAALHGPHAGERRHRVAGDEVSAGGVAQGNGVTPPSNHRRCRAPTSNARSAASQRGLGPVHVAGHRSRDGSRTIAFTRPSSSFTSKTV
jgi:hypothetical protein